MSLGNSTVLAPLGPKTEAGWNLVASDFRQVSLRIDDIIYYRQSIDRFPQGIQLAFLWPATVWNWLKMMAMRCSVLSWKPDAVVFDLLLDGAEIVSPPKARPTNINKSYSESQFFSRRRALARLHLRSERLRTATATPTT
jgi:hypothetical protein